jgi:hypothetical protein
MCGFLEFFSSVPDVIWSGVIASFLTLSGVLISNYSNTSRLRIQLTHDANEKTKERTAVLRRETYLNAVEELTKANSHLASISQKDPAKENLADGLQGFFCSAAKLQLVAEPKTALLVNQLVAQYGELMLKLLASAMPLHSLKNEIEICNEHYNKSQEQVSRILLEMTKFNESAQKNLDVFEALQRSSNIHQENANKLADEKIGLWQEHNRLTIDFTRELIMQMQLVSTQQIPVLVEIRRDLGLTTELEAFKLQMQEQMEKMNRQLNVILEKLQHG